jgi:hypothetical protein
MHRAAFVLCGSPLKSFQPILVANSACDAFGLSTMWARMASSSLSLWVATVVRHLHVSNQKSNRVRTGHDFWFDFELSR